MSRCGLGRRRPTPLQAVQRSGSGFEQLDDLIAVADGPTNRCRVKRPVPAATDLADFTTRVRWEVCWLHRVSVDSPAILVKEVPPAL